MEVRDETVGGVMDLLHALLPDELQEGAQGPLPLGSGFAKGMAESDAVGGDIVKGAEGEERVPDRRGPQPQLGREAGTTMEGGEMGV